MYIIRVCNDGQLAARYELQLTCGGTALSSSSVITGVSEVDGTLVVSVDGRVCSYNLTTIDTTSLCLRLCSGSYCYANVLSAY